MLTARMDGRLTGKPLGRHPSYEGSNPSRPAAALRYGACDGPVALPAEPVVSPARSGRGLRVSRRSAGGKRRQAADVASSAADGLPEARDSRLRPVDLPERPAAVLRVGHDLRVAVRVVPPPGRPATGA